MKRKKKFKLDEQRWHWQDRLFAYVVPSVALLFIFLHIVYETAS